MSEKALGANELGNGVENLALQEAQLLRRLGIQDSPKQQENIQQAVKLVKWLDESRSPEILRIREAIVQTLKNQTVPLKSLLGKSAREISMDVRKGQNAEDFQFGALLFELNQKILGKEKIWPAEVGYLRIKQHIFDQVLAVYSQEKQRKLIDGFEEEIFELNQLKALENFLMKTMADAGTDVVFENGDEKGFEQALELMLQFLVDQSGAAEISFSMDVQGDEKTYVLQKSALPAEFDPRESAENLTSFEQPITFKNSKGEEKVGTMVMKGKALDPRQQTILGIGAAKFGAYVQQWRKDFHTEQKGFPPRVVSLRKRGRLVEQSEEELTMFYCDIYGFTAISEQFNKLKKHGVKSGKLLDLIEAFEGKHKEILGDIGCYDKLVGDCVIAHFGPPYEFDRATNKKFDAFGLSESERNPAFYAMSALKTALKVRQSLSLLEGKFAELLCEAGLEIERLKPLSKKKLQARKDRSEAEVRLMVLEEFCEKNKFFPRLKVTQGFSTGMANVGLVKSANGNEKIDYSTSYTVIGDEMNLAARLQSAAKPHEMIINTKSKELIELAIENNLAVPFSADGKTETWQEFVTSYLGEKIEDFDLVLDFEPTILDLKNKEGFEVAYRLTIHEIPKVKPVTEEPIKITEQEFRNLTGKYVIDSENNNETASIYRLQNYFNRAEEYLVELPSSMVENRYIPEKDYDVWQNEMNCDDQVHVYNGKITVVNFLSIENLIDNQMRKMDQGKNIYEVNEVPHTLYQVVNILHPQDENDDYVEIELKKNGHTFFVKVDAESVQKLSSIHEPSSAHRYLDISAYPWVKKFQDPDQKRRLLSHPIFSPPQFFFLHVTGPYIGTLPELEHVNGEKKVDLSTWFPGLGEEVDSSGRRSLAPPSLL